MHELKCMRNMTKESIRLFIGTKELFHMIHSIPEKSSACCTGVLMIAKDIKDKKLCLLDWFLTWSKGKEM